MKGFKAQAERDISRIFINTDEFAQRHTIKFDGEVYKNMPIVIEESEQTERRASSGDHSEGICLVSAKAYFAYGDTGGKVPEQGKTLEIDDGEALGHMFFKRYRVVSVENSLGIICAELYAYDE